MSVLDPTVRLIIDGCVTLPDVVVGAELESLRAGFERCAARAGKRWLGWEEICDDADLMRYVLHPRLFAVVEAFGKHMGEDLVFANCSGMRDVYEPEKARDFKPFDPTRTNLRHGPMGWHDDVMGMKNPDARILQASLSSLLYLDDTFAHSGAFASAVGSHHLARATPDHKPVLAAGELVLDHCELRPAPVRAGSVLLYRAHHWHGVVPVGQQRRLFLQTFAARSTYDLQVGHTQVSERTRALIPRSGMRTCAGTKGPPEVVSKGTR